MRVNLSVNVGPNDSRKVQGCQPLCKLARLRRIQEGKANEPTGHPTKRHTKYRSSFYESDKRVKLARLRVKYENMLMEMYERAQ